MNAPRQMVCPVHFQLVWICGFSHADLDIFAVASIFVKRIKAEVDARRPKLKDAFLQPRTGEPDISVDLRCSDLVPYLGRQSRSAYCLK